LPALRRTVRSTIRWDSSRRRIPDI
jgi:hypothetical protein